MVKLAMAMTMHSAGIGICACIQQMPLVPNILELFSDDAYKYAYLILKICQQNLLP